MLEYWKKSDWGDYRSAHLSLNNDKLVELGFELLAQFALSFVNSKPLTNDLNILPVVESED